MNVCEWWSLRSALARFATFTGSTQSQRHIKPLHWYVACRLVVEGGFDPDEIVPRPPFRRRQATGTHESRLQGPPMPGPWRVEPAGYCSVARSAARAPARMFTNP